MKYDLSKFQGIFVALNAIYDKDDNINVSAIKELVNKYVEIGVNGIYACGSTGEGFLLSTDERKQVAQAVVEASDGRITTIIHVGAASTKEACELARHAKSIGADAISAVPSVYYRLSEDSIETHWNTITEATDLPFFIYNIPQLTGYDLSYGLLEKMLKNEKVIGIKDSAESTYQMERFRRIAGENFIIFNGPDEQFLAGKLMGANAGIGGTYGSMPELYIKLNEYINENKISEAQQLQEKINDCIQELCAFPSLYGASKAVIKLRYGIEAGIPRLPMLPVSTEDPNLIALVNKINRYVEEIE